jgi:DMSO/TMAO reductase YedYZ molybdopterin-dependent catalytic subunit
MKKTLWVILLMCLLCACSAAPSPSASADTASSATLQRYRDGELQEYEGMRLDPAIGPRDNSIKGMQHVDITSYKLTVDGLADQPQSLRYEDVKALPEQTRLVKIHCVEGWDATILWKGVLLEDLLQLAKPQATVNTVIFHAVDGYTTSLPLSEIHDKKLLLAYDANGLPLPAEMGYPFIVVAEDKWGYKWARWVNRIEMSSDASYKGYWEQNGYDNQADVPQKDR